MPSTTPAKWGETPEAGVREGMHGRPAKPRPVGILPLARLLAGAVSHWRKDPTDENLSAVRALSEEYDQARTRWMVAKREHLAPVPEDPATDLNGRISSIERCFHEDVRGLIARYAGKGGEAEAIVNRFKDLGFIDRRMVVTRLREFTAKAKSLLEKP